MLIFCRKRTKRCLGFPATTTKLPHSSSSKHPYLLPIVITLLAIFPFHQVALVIGTCLAESPHFVQIYRQVLPPWDKRSRMASRSCLLSTISSLWTTPTRYCYPRPSGLFFPFIHSLHMISFKLQNSLPHFICIHGFLLGACHDWRF